jgi:hypothetical protein
MTTPEQVAAVTPTVEQVAHRLWARTKEHGGQTRGEFNENTRPTRVIVEEFIAAALAEVCGLCPLLSEERWALGREAAILRTCMAIERSSSSLFRAEWLDLMGGGPAA